MEKTDEITSCICSSHLALISFTKRGSLIQRIGSRATFRKYQKFCFKKLKYSKLMFEVVNRMFARKICAKFGKLGRASSPCHALSWIALHVKKAGIHHTMELYSMILVFLTATAMIVALSWIALDVKNIPKQGYTKQYGLSMYNESYISIAWTMILVFLTATKVFSRYFWSTN